MRASAIQDEALPPRGNDPAFLPALDGAGGEAEETRSGAGAAELSDDGAGGAGMFHTHERIIRTSRAEFKPNLSGSSERTCGVSLSHVEEMIGTRTPQRTAGTRLKELRERAGLSVRRTAELIGCPFGTYSGWENESKRPYLPYDRAERLLLVLEGRGTPPITRADVLALAGDLDVTDQPGAAVAPSTSARLPLLMTREPYRVREYDVAAGAGHGMEPPALAGGEGAPVLAEWQLPAEFLAGHVTPASQLAIVRVEGDSMEPEYPAGHRVLVDLSRKAPSPPGVYVVWDGFGLVLKRLQVVAGASPARVKLSSINPQYDAYEVLLGDLHIAGRVIGLWNWR